MAANGVRRWWWVAAAVVVVVTAAGLTLLLLPRQPAKVAVPPPRTRTFASFEACLLTGARGLAEPGVANVWAGMQDVSDAKSIRVSYLPAGGDQTVAGVLPYVGALVQRGCGVILAVGLPEVAAARESAAKSPDVSFVVIGDADRQANVTVIAAADAGALRTAVGEAIRLRLQG